MLLKIAPAISAVTCYCVICKSSAACIPWVCRRASSGRDFLLCLAYRPIGMHCDHRAVLQRWYGQQSNNPVQILLWIRVWIDSGLWPEWTESYPISSLDRQAWQRQLTFNVCVVWQGSSKVANFSHLPNVFYKGWKNKHWENINPIPHPVAFFSVPHMVYGKLLFATKYLHPLSSRIATKQ